MTSAKYILLLGDRGFVGTTRLRLLPDSARPGVEPATVKSQRQRPNQYTTMPLTLLRG